MNHADDPHVNKRRHTAIHRSTDVDNRLRLSFFRRDPRLMTGPSLSKGSNGLLKTVDVLNWLSIFFDCKRKKVTSQKAHLMEVFEVHDGSVYNTISIQTPNRSTKKYESHSTVIQDLGNRLVIYHDTPLINIDEIREGGYQDCACCSQNEPDGVTIQSCSTCIDICNAIYAIGCSWSSVFVCASICGPAVGLCAGICAVLVTIICGGSGYIGCGPLCSNLGYCR
ncbi:hypothetical protein HUR95_01405 [Caldalkalibacillus thermarum TA2.A1]|uniref:Uncharacterized protein n=1 Tax=Caldalkalibacillus thermarum (strain TA2.A1) TaxID=986075 RepID=A0A8X8I9U1_CALTT|nr:hypothetical protein [Caldalkalibacillus thermarum]QZT34112.1 hypothetical protein HUR95_01405 [Caldalkalibacillus thermarum TA2.A1]